MPINPLHQTSNNQPRRILAIDPSTRELGVAVFEAEELIYYAVKVIRPRQPRRQLLQTAAGIVERLIEQFEPQVLAIERVALIQTSAALLSVVTEEIRTTAKTADLIIREYEPSSVRRQVCQASNATRNKTALMLSQRFPELTQYLQGQTKAQSLYYGHLFDAVAVGFVCVQETPKIRQAL